MTPKTKKYRIVAFLGGIGTILLAVGFTWIVGGQLGILGLFFVVAMAMMGLETISEAFT